MPAPGSKSHFTLGAWLLPPAVPVPAPVRVPTSLLPPSDRDRDREGTGPPRPVRTVPPGKSPLGVLTWTLVWLTGCGGVCVVLQGWKKGVCVGVWAIHFTTKLYEYESCYRVVRDFFPACQNWWYSSVRKHRSLCFHELNRVQLPFSTHS